MKEANDVGSSGRFSYVRALLDENERLFDLCFNSKTLRVAVQVSE